MPVLTDKQISDIRVVLFVAEQFAKEKMQTPETKGTRRAVLRGVKLIEDRMLSPAPVAMSDEQTSEIAQDVAKAIYPAGDELTHATAGVVYRIIRRHLAAAQEGR